MNTLATSSFVALLALKDHVRLMALSDVSPALGEVWVFVNVNVLPLVVLDAAKLIPKVRVQTP